jgi:hypothetical protein
MCCYSQRIFHIFLCGVGLQVPDQKYGWTLVPKTSAGVGGNATYQLMSNVKSYNGKGIILGYGNGFGESGEPTFTFCFVAHE